MRAVILEGSALEIAEALKGLDVSPSSTTVSLKEKAVETNEDDEEDDDEESEPVTLEVGRRFLTRRDVQPNQRLVLTAVYDAGEKGILGTRLQKLLKHEPAQFRGLMGALGRRLVNTKGYVDGSYFFCQEWDHEAGSYIYTLPPAAREAVKREVIDKA